MRRHASKRGGRRCARACRQGSRGAAAQLVLVGDARGGAAAAAAGRPGSRAARRAAAAGAAGSWTIVARVYMVFPRH